MNTLIQIPQDYIDSDTTLMSNYDHQIDPVVTERLMNADELADYPGRDFHAKVWYDKQAKVWYAAVRRYSAHMDTIEGETPDELRRNVSYEYGWD